MLGEEGSEPTGRDPIELQLPREATGSGSAQPSTTPVTRLIDTKSLLQVTPCHAYHGDKASFFSCKWSFLIAVRAIREPRNILSCLTTWQCMHVPITVRRDNETWRTTHEFHSRAIKGPVEGTPNHFVQNKLMDKIGEKIKMNRLTGNNNVTNNSFMFRLCCTHHCYLIFLFFLNFS